MCCLALSIFWVRRISASVESAMQDGSSSAAYYFSSKRCLMPRPCLLGGFLTSIFCLAGELIVGEALADDLAHGYVEAACIVHFAIVVPEYLIVEVPEQVEGFNRNVGPVQPALDQGPEVFEPVRMHFAAYIFHRVVYHFVLKLIKTFVRFQRIGEDCGTGKNVLADFRLKRLLFAVWNYGRAHFAAAFKDAHNGGLVLASGASDFFLGCPDAHVAGFASNEGFVRFDLRSEE